MFGKLFKWFSFENLFGIGTQPSNQSEKWTKNDCTKSFEEIIIVLMVRDEKHWTSR